MDSSILWTSISRPHSAYQKPAPVAFKLLTLVGIHFCIKPNLCHSQHHYWTSSCPQSKISPRSFQALIPQIVLCLTGVLGAYPLASLGHANWILRHFGYKAVFIWGLCLYGIGALIAWPCLLHRSFGGFCAAIFVIGNGLGSLETAANPYLAGE